MHFVSNFIIFEVNPPFLIHAIRLRVEVPASLIGLFLDFDLDAVGIGELVLPNAGNLPGNLDVRLVGPDREPVISDLLRNDGLSKLAYDRQLIPEIPIKHGEVIRKRYHGGSIGIGDNVAIVDIHHVR